MTALLTRLLGRLPIGWLQLTHSRTRLFAAIAGVMFANILVFVQLGIMGSFSESARMSYRSINADIAISSFDANTFFDGSNVPRQWLFRALSVPGVKEAMPLYMGALVWTQTDGSEIVFQSFGIDPTRPQFLGDDMPDPSDLVQADTVFVDSAARGLDPEKLATTSTADPIVIEAMGHQLSVIGTISIGGGFAGDGYSLLSDQTFFRLFPSRSAGAPNHILLNIIDGADPDQVVADLKRVLPADSLRIRTLETAIDEDVTYQSTVRPTGLIFGFGTVIGIMVGIVIVYQVLSTDVAAHLREYATFKAMGYSQAFLLSVIFEEAVILALFGFVPGFAVASLLYSFLNSATQLPVLMTSQLALMVFFGTLVSCALSGAIATRKLNHADPADLF